MTGEDDMGVEIPSGRNDDPDEIGVDDGMGIWRGRPRGSSSFIATGAGAGGAGACIAVRAERTLLG